MLLQDIRVKDWRNLAKESLSLGERVTVLFGRNGQGKSNILEAAYYAITFRSFRTNSTGELIGWGSEKSEIESRITLRGLERTIRVEVAVGKKRTTLDGKVVRRDSDSLQGAGVVVFGPDDLRLPKAAAGDRRRALDRAVFASQRSYIREALAFERALRGRNSLLRRGIFTKELLESFEETLALTGARIVVRRRDLVRSLAPMFAKVFREIHGELTARISYRSHARIEAVEGEEAIREALRLGLEAERASDQRRGFTGFGPQTDDLDMFLGDHLAREHGSQGQVRSLVLAFKIAELLHAESQNQETPVLLLDDVSSELDAERRARLFETISTIACQTLITVTEREHLPDLPGRVDWRVSGGHVERV